MKPIHCIIEILGMIIVIFAASVQIGILSEINDIKLNGKFLSMEFEINAVRNDVMESRVTMGRIELRQIGCLQAFAESRALAKSKLIDFCRDSLAEANKLLREAHVVGENKKPEIPNNNHKKEWVLWYVIGSTLLVIAKYIERMHLKK